MWRQSELGTRCHWCGEYVQGNAPKTGNHVFCKNGGKCKMAHARAIAAYRQRTARVTPTSGPSSAAGETPGRKGNSRRSKHA